MAPSLKSNHHSQKNLKQDNACIGLRCHHHTGSEMKHPDGCLIHPLESFHTSLLAWAHKWVSVRGDGIVRWMILQWPHPTNGPARLDPFECDRRGIVTDFSSMPTNWVSASSTLVQHPLVSTKKEKNHHLLQSNVPPRLLAKQVSASPTSTWWLSSPAGEIHRDNNHMELKEKVQEKFSHWK